MIETLDPILKITRRSHVIPTSTQVLAALRFYASGSLQSVVADTVGLTQASVSRVISRVTNVLSEKSKEEIEIPSGVVEINRTIKDFGRINGFPKVIGAIDGTHIPIKGPINNLHSVLGVREVSFSQPLQLFREMWFIACCSVCL